LVAAGVINSPFPYCDVVTTTTHKTLRGPRSGIIFFRRGSRQVAGKEVPYKIEDDINFAVFPSLQGGPHNHIIAGVATALKEADSEEFVQYQTQVVANSRAFCKQLQDRGYKIVSGGTDNHLFNVDLRPKGIDGGRVDKVLDACGITANKNTVPGDKSALRPGGIRLGTPALTSRGFTQTDFEPVADFIHQGVELAKKVQDKCSGKLIKEFKELLATDPDITAEVAVIKQRVGAFARSFPIPGHDEY